MTFTFYLYFLLFLQMVHYGESKTLLMAQALWRHGDRPPIEILSYDQYKNYDWGVPLGQLNQEGMKRHYYLGLSLAERYINQFRLVNSTFHVEDIHVRSTDVDRTLASAYSNLQGFYSKSKINYPNNEPNYPPFNPIAIHTVEETTDWLLNPYWKCAKSEKLSNARINNPSFLKYAKTYSDLFNYLSSHTNEKIDSYHEVKKMFGTIRVENQYGLKQPDWLTPQIYQRMEKMINDTVNYSYGCAGFGVKQDVEQIKLRAGHLLYRIIENMKTKTAAPNDIKPYTIFSAHDTTLMAFANTLNFKTEVMGQGLIDYAGR
uniref:Lysosomal acid phosphatase n=1 Tax=Rhabditophanes sp. KR3021 TaxID=114890 RepID=A0AC35UHJ2_9BILA